MFVNIHFSSHFLSNLRSGEVTLLASSKSGSLLTLSPPPSHTSETFFFSSSNPRDFQLLSPPPPRLSFASESFFSSPDNSDTLPLPLWAFPKCDTVISFWETTSALGVQTSHCAAQWDVCLGDDSSFVQSVRFFGSKVRPNGHYGSFFPFQSKLKVVMGSVDLWLIEQKEKWVVDATGAVKSTSSAQQFHKKGWKPQNMAWKKTVILKIDWCWIYVWKLNISEN